MQNKLIAFANAHGLKAFASGAGVSIVIPTTLNGQPSNDLVEFVTDFAGARAALGY